MIELFFCFPCSVTTLAQITRVNLPFWHQDPHLLPDLFISSLTVATLIFVLTNTHRFVILRRFFIIYGCADA